MKNFKITTEQENEQNIREAKFQEKIIKTLNSDAAKREEEKLQQLNDTILINKAIGLINLDFCIDNDLDFAELAKAINRQRK